MSLTFFPARVDIGVMIGPDGKTYGVKMTPEFERALGTLATQTGGSSNEDLELLAAQAGTTSTQVPDAAPFDPDPTIARLSNEVAGLRAQLQELMQVVYQLGQAGAASRASDAEQLLFAQLGQGSGTDWAHPGKIGSGKPNTGKFTTLEASGAITSTLASGGAAPLVIASDTVVPNLNVSKLLGRTWASPGDIGTVAPKSAAFAGASTSAVVTLSRTGTSAGSGAIGADAAYAFRAFNSGFADVFNVAQGAAQFNVTGGGFSTTGSGTISGNCTVGAGFGCNAKGPQGAAASGGTLAGVIAALVANGILSS